MSAMKSRDEMLHDPMWRKCLASLRSEADGEEEETTHRCFQYVLEEASHRSRDQPVAEIARQLQRKLRICCLIVGPLIGEYIPRLATHCMQIISISASRVSMSVGFLLSV